MDRTTIGRIARGLLDGPSRQVGIAAAVIMALLIALFAYDHSQRYEAALADADRATQNAALLIAEHTAQSFDSIRAILTAAATLRDEVAEGRHRDKATIHNLLKAIPGGSPMLRAVSWTDAEGNRIATSQFPDPPPLNVADQEHFIAQRDAPGNGLYIAAPTRSKLTGDLVINVSRRFETSDGRFAGVVTGVIDPSYFAAVYRSVELAPSRVAVLLRGDGTILVREPRADNLLGQSAAQGIFFQKYLPHAPSGTVHGRFPAQGAERIASYARVPRSSQIVLVSILRADALKTFYANLAQGGLRLGVMLAVLAVGAHLLAVQLRRRQRADSQFRELLEGAPDAMVIADKEGRILLVNKQLETLFGYERGEVLGQQIEMLMPDQFRAQHLAHRRAFMSHPRTRPMGAGLDLRGRRKDGTEFAIEVSLSPLQTEQGLLISGAIRDITARKRVEAELTEAKQAAEASSRAKSDFLSSMSHDLRTPLNAVIGFAQMLEMNRERTLTAKQREYCEYIKSGGNHLLDLVNEVLDLAGIESGRLKLSIEPVKVQDALETVHAAMSPLAAKAGVSLNVAVTAMIADIRADDFRLRQVLINLVSNAIKYNWPRGSVTMTAEATPSERIRLVVTDTGAGIPAERQKELFEPFHRLGAEHTDVEGTGIGLALSRRLVEAMGGNIGFTSEVGRGSTFWIEFPTTAETAPVQISADVDAAAAPRAKAGGYSLLYVEDNPANLRLMEHLVSTLPNVAMLAAPTPQLGLEMAVAHRPNVIVLDLNLPGMSGFAVLARLKAMPETRDIPVVALTAAAFPRDIKRGLAAGFFRYITKPLDVNAFLAAVYDALALNDAPSKATG